VNEVLGNAQFVVDTEFLEEFCEFVMYCLRRFPNAVSGHMLRLAAAVLASQSVIRRISKDFLKLAADIVLKNEENVMDLLCFNQNLIDMVMKSAEMILGMSCG
jgi:hypothetical protein